MLLVLSSAGARGAKGSNETTRVRFLRRKFEKRKSTQGPVMLVNFIVCYITDTIDPK